VDRYLERQEVGVHEVLLCDDGRVVVARVRLARTGGVLHRVGRVVLAAGARLDVVRVLWRLLEALDEVLRVLADLVG
jgi:hypothetical protein